jgi:subtilisin
MALQPAYSTPFSQEHRQSLKLVEHFTGITPDQIWEGATGKGVKVAIIDSGIEATHPAVNGPVSGYVCISEDAQGLVYNYDPHIDIYGHGTACAGIIRALAPECELYSVRVLGQALTGRGVVFAAGLRWAIENGMHVCNLSLGTTKKDFYALLHELTDLAAFQNIPIVCAANNMLIPSFPSMYSSVISVASHDGNDPYTFYYNPKPPIEFGAPGIDVRVAWQNGEWINATGNSFAAPHITGLITKILSKHPGLTVFELKTILHSLASNIERGK